MFFRRAGALVATMLILLGAAIPSLASAQSSALQPSPPLAGPSAVPDAPTGAPQLAPAGADAAGSRITSLDYKLGAGDKLRIIVYGEPDLTGEFFVSGAGGVSFPLIGVVPAASLTIGEFQTEIHDALQKGYLKEPRVSVEVLTYRPFYILGEVNHPGEYPYTNGLNVLNAVATAGGFTYRAQTHKVLVRRVGVQKEEVLPMSSDTLVAPGDTIRVVERFF